MLAEKLEVVVPAWSGRVYVIADALRLAKARELPDMKGQHKPPLLPGRRVAPAEVILQGPKVFQAWRQEHPDQIQYQTPDFPEKG